MRETTGVVVRALVGAAIGAAAVTQANEASALRDRPVTVAIVLLCTAVVVAALPMVQEHLAVPGAVPALVGVTQFAIYCCVPETDQIPEVVGAVVVLLALEVAARRALWWWLVAPVLGYVVWSGLFGATGRESALVGTLFAMWPLVLVTVVVVWRHGSPWVGAVVGSVAAVVVARTGALQPTVRPAYVAAAVAGAASVVAVVVSAVVARPPAGSQRDRSSR